MVSPPSNANNQIVLVSDVASKRHKGPSVDQGAGQARAVDHAPAPVENNQLLIPEHDREYGCRYCHKKFSNKQALGGHQNAHKVERAMEKNEQDNGIGYFGSPPSSYHGRFSMAAAAPFLTSYNHRPNDFLHRSPYSWSFTSHHPGGGGGSVIPYSSRPLPPAAGGYYSGWSSAPPGPRMGPFPGRPHYPLPGQNINIRLANFGAGSSNAMRPGFPGAGGRPGGGNNGPSVPINLRNVPAAQQSGESDLDLSLKL